ncbi:MAG: FkbM family methyltransferase [Acidobacteria bacterium]|nr:FkbM family methyltransferase [Acidobacteriota bacterium]
MPSQPAPPVTGWRKAVLIALRIVIVTGLLVIGLGAVVRLMPGSVPFALALSGRSRMCSPQEVWQVGAVRKQLHEETLELRKSSKIVETDADGNELWETPVGRFWLPHGSEEAAAVLIAQQEVDQYGAIHGDVKPGDIVLDAGAHVGLYARKALEKGAKTVVAIEPAPANLECLRRNLAQEIADGKVIVYPKGVWDKEEDLPLFEDPNNSAADTFIHNSETMVAHHTIPLTRIDTLVQELGLERVDVIKMDIKGATQKALAGGAETIRKDRPHIVLSTEEDNDDPYAIAEQIASIDPSYHTGCGGCFIGAGGAIEPDIIHLMPGDSK